MKHVGMTSQPEDPPDPDGRGASRSRPVRRDPGHKAERAFDVWLQRGLHQMYDSVAREPVPDSLLRLIEDDRPSPSEPDQPGPDQPRLKKGNHDS